MRTITLTGKYNETCYVIVKGHNEVLYQSGNHPGDSQVYLKAEDGVGLERMRRYCRSTLLDMVKKNKQCHMGDVRYVKSLKPIRTPW